MRFRRLTALAALAGAAVLALSGCDSNIGTAAVVGGDHIADATVNQYLTPDAAPFSVPSGSSTERIVPRSYVLSILIQQRLFTAALARSKGGAPSQADIHSAEDLVKQGSTDAQIVEQYTQYGFATSFAALSVRNTALEQILAERLNLTNDPGPLLKAVGDLHQTVDVSARYGVWQSKSLSIDSAPAAGAPSFVTLHIPPADAAAAPAGGQ